MSMLERFVRALSQEEREQLRRAIDAVEAANKELLERERMLADRGKQVLATKEVYRRTGMPLEKAKRLVEDYLSGRP